MEDDKALLKENIEFIVIHCSDTNENNKVDDIHKLHLSFGWDGIGYHKVIEKDGNIENGRPEFWKGAHVYNFNDKSLGICLIGKNNFNKRQFKSLKKILISWKLKYPKAKIVGHNYFKNTNKTCPNFNVDLWCKKEKLN